MRKTSGKFVFSFTHAIREKIATLKGSEQILVPKPLSANKRLLNSERIITLIDQFEMRLVKPEIIDSEMKLMRKFWTTGGGAGSGIR